MSTDFDKITDIRAFCDEMRLLAKRGSMGEALGAIADFVFEVLMRESSWANVFASPELDALCLELGKLPDSVAIAPVDPQRTVFLVTGVEGVGGHTRVLMDLAHVDPGVCKTVLVSNVKHDLTTERVRAILHKLDPSVEVEVAPADGIAETLTWLQERLASLRPARSYILLHHFDSAIVAAVQPQLVGRLFYYHNCDNNMALGVHIPHATHVDFNGKGFHHCRNIKGVVNGVFWPLVADVSVHRANLPFMESGRVTTATSGGWPKFDNSFLSEQMPYLYDYKSMLPLIMRATGSEHIHIGPLREELLHPIKARLASSGVNPEKFVHIPWVDNVAAELVRRKVDLYVGSFPLGGGRATIEAMGAGMPILLHANYGTSFHTDIGEVYPGVLQWRDPDQLTKILTGLSKEILVDRALRARAFFEGRFTLENLRQAVEATLAGSPPEPPAAPAYFPNALQRYLDLRAVLRSRTPAAHEPAASPDAHEPAASPDAHEPAAPPDAHEPAASPDAHEPAASPDAHEPAAPPDAHEPAAPPDAPNPYPDLAQATLGAQEIRTRHLAAILLRRVAQVAKRSLTGG
jgi:hypothetical protein